MLEFSKDVFEKYSYELRIKNKTRNLGPFGLPETSGPTMLPHMRQDDHGNALKFLAKNLFENSKFQTDEIVWSERL